MTNEEAYNKMGEGYAVSHKLFSKNEYLYMDESFIMRDENDEEYESSWDLKLDDPVWKTDWYINKNRKQNMNLKQASLALAYDTVDSLKRLDNNGGYLPPLLDFKESPEDGNKYYNPMTDSNEDPVIPSSRKKKISNRVKGRIFESLWILNLIVSTTYLANDNITSRLVVTVPIILGSIFSALWWSRDLKE